MIKYTKSKQIFITTLNYPYDSVNALLFESDFANKIFDSEFKVKLFIGSDWSIKNSGFSFYDSKGFNAVLELKKIIKNDFIRTSNYSITYMNDNPINIELELQSCLIKNTHDNTCVYEMRIEYNSEEIIKIFKQYVKVSYIKEIVTKIFNKINTLFANESMNKENMDKFPKTYLNQSFIIKKNYKDAFNFFYNWNNLAKTLKTDKSWKIKNEINLENSSYKNFSILIDDDIKIYYKVISIVEVKNEKIEIIYDKHGKHYVPALNNFIKFTLYHINKDLSLFLYETHLPFNIRSSIFQTVSYYLFYCNMQSRKYIENL